MAVEQVEQRDAQSAGDQSGSSVEATARNNLFDEFRSSTSDGFGASTFSRFGDSTSDRSAASTSPCERDYEPRSGDDRQFPQATPSRELKNELANDALNQSGERRSEAPLSEEDRKLAADGTRLVKDYLGSIGDMGSNKANESFNALNKLFGQMDPAQQDRVIGAMNESLRGSQNRLARVPETGEVWLGSQSAGGSRYHLSTLLHRPSCAMS